MDFEILTEIDDVETIAIGNAIREIGRLRKVYGQGHWRKLKGIATVLLPNGTAYQYEMINLGELIRFGRKKRPAGDDFYV